MSDAAPTATAPASGSPAGGGAAPAVAAPAGGGAGGSPAGAVAAPAGGNGSATPAAPATLGAGLTPPATTPAPAAVTTPADSAAAKPGETPAPAQPYTLTAPKDSPFTPEQLAEAAKDAHAHGLPQAVAQKWLDTQAARVAQLRTEYAAAEKAKLAKWGAELAADPEFSGEQYGAKLKAADAALGKIAGPDADHVRNALAEAGILNHPAIIRTFARLAKLTGNDSIEGGTPSVGELTLEQRMYGKAS